MKARFAVIGSGWRSDFYLRIAQQMPELFICTGLSSRSKEKGDMIRTKWNVPIFADPLDMLAQVKPDFAVISVARDATASVIAHVAGTGIPVLAETFLLGSENALNELYQHIGGKHRIQVAEQYHLQPMQQARINIAKSGLLGEVFEAQVSISQCYHGISVMRKLLGVGFAPCTITSKCFEGRLIRGPWRTGGPEKDEIVPDVQTLGWFDFNRMLGVFDNSMGQLRSWVRTQRTVVTGDRGEVDCLELRYLLDYKTPMEDTLRRIECGREENLESIGLKGITACGRYYYMNPFYGKAFIDDEIAVAEVLLRMAEYAAGGESFYPLEQALQDQYLSIIMEKAAEEGRSIKTTRQSWMPD